jgi:5-formyltetrahydrofolate cyclo-ligase
VTDSPLPPAADDASLKALRRTLRARRRAVPAAERRSAALALARRVERAGLLCPGRRLGLYLPLPEEIDTRVLLQRALRRGCRVYVPRVTDYRRHQMRFLPIAGRLKSSRYGILEPRGGIARTAHGLDVILMPLVGFDARGNRIGMGKGYYDRALAFLQQRRCYRRPLLVGLAFDCQRVAALPARPHDVPLGRVITPTTVYRFASAPRHPGP